MERKEGNVRDGMKRKEGDLDETLRRKRKKEKYGRKWR